MTNTPINLGPVRIDPVTQSEALEAIAALVAARRGGFVVTPNVDHILRAQEDPWFRALYNSARLSLADGQPVVWLARLLGRPVPEKVSGSDLLLPLIARAAASGWRVFLFGGSPEASAEASRRLQARFPALQIVGRDTSVWTPGAADPTAARELAERIRASRADLVVVALGSPKQELWMDAFAEAIAPAVALGIGASLDFIAGFSRRAPAWMSKAGLEWLHRLAQEPRRLAHRYLVRGPRFIPLALGEAARQVGARVARSGRHAWEVVAGRPLRVAAALRDGCQPLREVVIVGRGPLGRVAAADLGAIRGTHVVGAFSLPGDTARSGAELPDLGPSAGLMEFLIANPVDEVYLAAEVHKHHAALQQAVRVCEELGIPFAIPSQTLRLARALPLDRRSVGDGFLHYDVVPARRLHDSFKRALDVVLAAGALVGLAPLFLAVAVAIKATSKGPVFFKQVRVGLRGRPFNMYKFRSMVVDAEAQLAALLAQNEQTGPVFKIRRDPRITRIGAFIRAFSIDELPQLINILRGEMAIVGPRPPVPREVAQYLPWQRRRLSVRPGLTCFWQVKGRNEIGFEEWMRLDLNYIDQWSMGTDIKLIGRTIPVVLNRQGAS